MPARIQLIDHLMTDWLEQHYWAAKHPTEASAVVAVRGLALGGYRRSHGGDLVAEAI